jgi:signal peptidase I
MLLLLVPFRNAFAVKGIAENILPADRVNASQIEITSDRITIYIDNVSISNYANTSSMYPTITENAKGVNIVPESPAEIKAGDIITYEQDNILIVHRVVEIGDDGEWYAITKGDATETADGKVRFEQIKSILIGILY